MTGESGANKTMEMRQMLTEHNVRFESCGKHATWVDTHSGLKLLIIDNGGCFVITGLDARSAAYAAVMLS